VSIKIITAVLNLTPDVVTAPERLVLLALAWHADEHGRNAWPAVGTLARKTSLTRRGVQKILHKLTQKGFLYVESVEARRSALYAIDMAALDCERYSQSAPPSSPVDCEPRSQGGRTPFAGGANPVRRGGEPRSPDPYVNRPVTVREEESGAGAPGPLTTNAKSEEGDERGNGSSSRSIAAIRQQMAASMRRPYQRHTKAGARR
jgi:hypothetical protein